MQMFLGQKDPVQSWLVQNGQCKVETNRKNGLSNGILLEVHLVHFRLSLAAYRTSRFSAPLPCLPILKSLRLRQYQLCICVEHSTSFVKHLFNFQSR